MGTSFRPYSPDQELLLPASLNEWLAEGHLAYFISDVVEERDLSAFYARYEGDGRRKSPFDPRMMLKVLIYAYANSVFPPVRLPGSWKKTWPFACWRPTISPGIEPCAISANSTWVRSERCLFRSSRLPGRRS